MFFIAIICVDNAGACVSGCSVSSGLAVDDLMMYEIR